MAQHFEQPLETGSELRTQRMTAEESRAVIDLWQQEQTELTGLTDKPAVPDVAEGLDITVEDVQRLLSEVRAREERALVSEQELSEIRRQRAELRREQAEGERQQAINPKWLRSSERISQSELGALYIKKETSSLGYHTAAVLIVVILGWFYHYVETPHPPQRLYVSHASASYDAQGKVSAVDMTCVDSPGHEVPCDDAILASEKAYFQESHDWQVADAKKNANAKKSHDKQTHR